VAVSSPQAPLQSLTLVSLLGLWALLASACVPPTIYEVDPTLEEPTTTSEGEATSSSSNGETGSTGQTSAAGTSSGSGGDTSASSGGTGGAAGEYSGPVIVTAPDPDRSTSIADIDVEYGSCVATGAGFNCPSIWTAPEDMSVRFDRNTVGTICGGGTTYAYDDLGGRYVPSLVRVSNDSADGCSLPRDLIEGISTQVTYEFSDLQRGAREIALLRVSAGVDGVNEQLLLRELPIFGADDPAPSMPRYPQVEQFGDMVVEAASCRDTAGSLDCFLRVTSPEDERTVSFTTRTSGTICGGSDTKAFDSTGAEYTASRVDVANETHNNTCSLTRVLARDVPTPFMFRFDDLEPGADSVARLEFTLQVDGIATPVEFNDLEIERD